MMTMTTMQHQGHGVRRTRRVACAGRRPDAAVLCGLGTTGVDVYSRSVSADGAWGHTTGTTEPADATVNARMTIKCSARHLGTRST